MEVYMSTNQGLPQITPTRESFWRRNQIVLTFVTSDSPPQDDVAKQKILDHLPFAQINEFLRTQSPAVALRSFGPDDVPSRGRAKAGSSVASSGNLTDPLGKYAFAALEGRKDGENSVIVACFHLDLLNPSEAQGEPALPDGT